MTTVYAIMMSDMRIFETVEGMLMRRRVASRQSTIMMMCIFLRSLLLSAWVVLIW